MTTLMEMMDNAKEIKIDENEIKRDCVENWESKKNEILKEIGKAIEHGFEDDLDILKKFYREHLKCDMFTYRYNPDLPVYIDAYFL